MSSDLPRGMRVESTASGVRFTVPVHNGLSEWLVRCFLAFIVLFFGLALACGVFGTRQSTLPAFIAVMVVSLVLELLAIWALVVTSSRSTIEVSQGSLVLDRGFGHFHRKVAKPSEQVRALRLHFRRLSISRRMPPFAQDDLPLWSSNRCLVIDWIEGGEPWPLCPGASLHYSLAVATTFQSAMGRYLPNAAPDGWPPIEVEEPLNIRGVTSDIPANSGISMLEDEMGTTINVPPEETHPERTALRKLGGLFAAFWFLVLGLLLAFNVVWWGYLILAGAAAGHACLMFEAFRKRRAGLEIVADEQGLRIIETTFKRRREHTWKGEEIRSVELRNGAVNSEDEESLLIDTARGRWNFMKQRNALHIAWVVTAIHRALGWDLTEGP